LNGIASILYYTILVLAPKWCGIKGMVHQKIKIFNLHTLKFLAAEHKDILKDNSCVTPFTSIALFSIIWKSIGAHQLFGNEHSSKYFLLCSAEQIHLYMFGTT